MAWIYLLIAVALEVTWAVGLRFTQSWSKLWPSVVVLAAYMACIVPLSLATKTIPVSVAYSAWVGLGIVGVGLVDIFYFGEPATLPKIACILLILAGAVGLKLLSSGGH